MRLTISFKTFFPFTDAFAFAFAFAFPFTDRLKSFELSKHIRTRKRWNLVYFMDNFAFCEVLLVFPIRMVWREELSMQVKGNILATLLQPNENQGLHAHWARHLSTCTPSAEQGIARKVMHAIL